MLNYMIIFKECFRTARLTRFKVYSFVTPFPNTKVSGWGLTVGVLEPRFRRLLIEYKIKMHM